MGNAAPLSGPDLSLGVDAASVAEGKPLLGHAQGEAVLLVRSDGQLFAVSATCTHYSGPLAEGLQVGHTVRCPWHHARFDVRTGTAVGAPALNPLGCYALEEQGGKVRVTGKKDAPAVKAQAGLPSVVIVGGGAAGNSAAETLRNEGYAGTITLLSADQSVPVDRPNLSKDYLAGNAPEEWLPLRGEDFYKEKKITLRTNTRVASIDTVTKKVQLQDGSTLEYGALVLATGAEPIRLPIPGAHLPHVFVLRTLADCKAILGAVGQAKTAVVLGASFIGLEVAASLRTRGLEVHVVAPEAKPFERVLGAPVGEWIQKVHEEHAVNFHLKMTATAIDAKEVTLSNGERIAAELVILGVGVRPVFDLAEKAGLAVDRGVKVNAFLETSAPGVYAAGDIARYPDPRTGEQVRIEHWVVAQRQGQTVARNILGKKQPFNQAPFFWTTQYDVTLSYVGHAESWDTLDIEGSLEKRDATVKYKKKDRVLAVLTVGRDQASLENEVQLEG